MKKEEKSLTYFVPNPISGPPGLSTPEARARYVITNEMPAAEREQIETACRALGCTLEEWIAANVAVAQEHEEELRAMVERSDRGEVSRLSVHDYMAGLVAERVKANQRARVPIIGEKGSHNEGGARDV